MCLDFRFNTAMHVTANVHLGGTLSTQPCLACGSKHNNSPKLDFNVRSSYHLSKMQQNYGNTVKSKGMPF